MDAPQLRAAYEKYFPIIRAKCARMLSDPEEAADVAQETFIRLWQSPMAGKTPEQLSAWIYQTSTRAAIDRLRHRGRQRTLSQRAAIHGHGFDGRQGAGVPMDEAALLARRLLQHLADKLPEDELEVAILSRIDALSHAEIAEVAACSERTVRRLLQRFDERLEKLPAELQL